jgi:hypothetical protein
MLKIVLHETVFTNYNYPIFNQKLQIKNEVNITSINSASSPDFVFIMNNVSFILTKNFNSKVNCSFQVMQGIFLMQTPLPLTNG